MDFPSYNVNLGDVNFFGGSIPLIYRESRVWYFGISSLYSSLIVRAINLEEGITLLKADALWSLSLVRRSHSRFCLALSNLRRSLPESAQLGDSLRLFDVTDLLSVRLSRIIWDRHCLLSQPSRGGRVNSLILSSNCPTLAAGAYFIILLSTKICAIFAI